MGRPAAAAQPFESESPQWDLWSLVLGPCYLVPGMRVCGGQNLREHVRSAHMGPSCGPPGAGELPLCTDALVKDKVVYTDFLTAKVVYMPQRPQSGHIHHL